MAGFGRLDSNLKSAAFTGVVAFVVYIVIALATGGSAAVSIGIAVGVGVVAFAISYAVGRYKADKAGRSRV